NELERGVADLELGGGRLEVEEGLDVSAHGDVTVRGGRQDSGGCAALASAPVRVQRDPIAFAVENDRPVAVRADRVRRLQDLAACGGDGALRVGDASVDVEVDEGSARRRCVVVVG